MSDLHARLLAEIERREGIARPYVIGHGSHGEREAAYLAALREIVELHHETGDGGERWCDSCGGDPACPTLLAVAGALAVQP